MRLHCFHDGMEWSEVKQRNLSILSKLIHIVKQISNLVPLLSYVQPVKYFNHTPSSAVIALGSEMSGGIQDVRAEDILAINSESRVRIKSVAGRGGYVKDIYVRGMTMKTMKWAFWMTGDYGGNITMVADNVTMAAQLGGISCDPFTSICISNVTIEIYMKSKKVPWNCTDVSGISSGVISQPCNLLQDQGSYGAECSFPTDCLLIENVELQMCSCKSNYL